MKNNNIIIISPPAVRLRSEGEVLSSVRLGTPETTLGLLSKMIRNLFPKLNLKLISPRKDDGCSPKYFKTVKYGKSEIDIDYLGVNIKKYEDEISNAWIILISNNFTQESGACKKLISEIRDINRNSLIIVGGTDAMFRPAYYLHNGANIVIRGESEVILPLLLNKLSKSADISQIPNIAWRNKNNKIKFSNMMYPKSRETWLPQEINFLCPELNKISVGNEFNEGSPPPGVSEESIYIETSRGCIPANCNFCTTPFKTGGKSGFRTYPFDIIRQNIANLCAKNISTLQIIDDNILARTDIQNGIETLNDIFNYFREKKFAWEFSNGLQISRLFKGNKPDIDLMKCLFSPEYSSEGNLIGGYRAFLPLETCLRERRPNGYKKWSKLNKLNTNNIIMLIEALDKSDIMMLSLGVMIGFPDDTYSDIEETIEGMKHVEKAISNINNYRRKINISEIKVHWDIMIYMLLPGTYDFNLNRDRIILKDDYINTPELLNFQTAAYWPDNFSPWELTDIRAQIAKEFSGHEVTIDNKLSTSHNFVSL